MNYRDNKSNQLGFNFEKTAQPEIQKLETVNNSSHNETKEWISTILSNDENEIEKKLNKLVDDIEIQLLLKNFNNEKYNEILLLENIRRFNWRFLPFFNKKNTPIYKKYINKYFEYSRFYNLYKILLWFTNNEINNKIFNREKIDLNNNLKNYFESWWTMDAFRTFFNENEMIFLLNINKELRT